MKLAIVLMVAFAAVATAAPLTEENHEFLFVSWAKEHNKVYEHDQFFQRFSIFKNNLNMVHEHTQRFEAGEETYSVAMNEYGDWTWEEFKARKFGYTPRQRSFMRSMNVADNKNVTIPTSVDWTTKKAVTPVKNQEQCGSCWAFSTTGSVEGAHAIKSGKLVSLSEQQLVDCSGAEGNMGCNGGLMDDAFEYIIKNGGLCSESDYPYKAADGTCQTSCTKVVTISSYKDVAKDDEKSLEAAAAIGPVSIAIEADHQSFQFYSGGVFNDPNCGTQLDHGVLIVGYGVDSGKNYWKVKNSWGATWGEQGYIRMAKDVGGAGMCGLASDPSYPIA